MKQSNFFKMVIISGCLVTLLYSSCTKKNQEVTGPPAKDSNDNQEVAMSPAKERTVTYKLSTDADFSGWKDSIFFRITLERLRRPYLIWDSALVPVRLNEIPVAPASFTFTKIIPATDTGTLRIGFQYYIQNIGYSWKFDTIGRNEKSKVFHFDFRG